MFPEGNAIGKPIRLGQGKRVFTVIGIAADATPGDPRIQGVFQCYLPLGPVAPPAPALLVRVKTGALSEASLRALIEPLGHHEVLRVSTMHAQTERFLVQERLITSASLFFAALAAVVSISGLYATIAQNITHRRREIGIRIAVGATPNMIRALVVTNVCRIVLIGVSLGIPAALAEGHAARSLLSTTSINTTTLLVMTGLAIAGGALLVSAWPAQRAACTPVATALRSD